MTLVWAEQNQGDLKRLWLDGEIQCNIVPSESSLLVVIGFEEYTTIVPYFRVFILEFSSSIVEGRNFR